MFLSAIESAKTEFEPHPKGVANGVCVEVVTRNKKTGEPFTIVTKEGDVKNRIILVFQTDKTTTKENGDVVNCAYWDWHNAPQSIANENGRLHQRRKDWEVAIKDYPTQEAFEKAVVGRPATLVFTHNAADNGKTYSNLTSCTPVDEGAKAFEAVDYQTYNEGAPF